MNESHANQAHESYSAISSLVTAIKTIEANKHNRRLNISISGKKDADRHASEEIILGSNILSPTMAREIIDFALRRRIAELQDRINEHGRRLAQLGFTKPEACK